MRFVGIAILGAAAAQAGFMPKQQPLMTMPSYDVNEMEDPQLSLAEASDTDETAMSDADEISAMTDSEDHNLNDTEMEMTDETEDSESNADEEEDFDADADGDSESNADEDEDFDADADGMDVAKIDEASDESEDHSATEMTDATEDFDVYARKKKNWNVKQLSVFDKKGGIKLATSLINEIGISKKGQRGACRDKIKAQIKNNRAALKSKYCSAALKVISVSKETLHKDNIPMSKRAKRQWVMACRRGLKTVCSKVRE